MSRKSPRILRQNLYLFVPSLPWNCRKSLRRNTSLYSEMAAPQPLRDARITNASMRAALKNPSDFISLSDEVWGIFCFWGKCFSKAVQLLGSTFAENIGVSKGENPRWLWVSNRGEQCPVGTRLCPQSLVCYTFCNRGRLKGAVRRGNGHFEMTTGQADFANLPVRESIEFA